MARIGLAPEEIERAGREMEDILRYVDRLQSIDTAGVDEASPLPVAADAFRVDAVADCGQEIRSEISANFPAAHAGLLKAPAVFEKPKA